MSLSRTRVHKSILTYLSLGSTSSSEAYFQDYIMEKSLIGIFHKQHRAAHGTEIRDSIFQYVLIQSSVVQGLRTEMYLC